MFDFISFCKDLKRPGSHLQTTTPLIIHEIYVHVKALSQKKPLFFNNWRHDFEYIYGDLEYNLSRNYKLNTEMLFSLYGIQSDEKNKEDILHLFFSLQIFISVFIKSLTQNVLKVSNRGFIPITKQTLTGEFATEFGIINYCSNDYYTQVMLEDTIGEKILSLFENLLSSYGNNMKNFQNMDFSDNIDYIKQIYETIIPKEFRHALGEYYTPNWLVEKIIKSTDEIIANVDKKTTFVDPTCGSGSFLCKIVTYKKNNNVEFDKIISSVWGCDINPLAVLIAKTNYLLSIIDIIPKNKKFKIPIFNIDIIKTFGHNTPTNKLNAASQFDVDEALAMGSADVIVGNPPWVNWEYMPVEYRQESQQIWQKYLLFSQKGLDLSFSKEDISILITYIVLDKLLKDDGILVFVIRQGVFKSAQNGANFRRFKIKDNCELKVLRVEDFSSIKVFENASTQTSICFIQKGSKNQYPVPYFVWEKKKNVSRINLYANIQLLAALEQLECHEQIAIPAIKEDVTSSWLTATPTTLQQIDSFLGKNDYRARTGIFTGGANGVYWLSILAATTTHVCVSNIVERAKRKVEQKETVIEKELVYPLLKGSNIKQWNVCYDTYLLCPHTIQSKMKPIPYHIIQEQYPASYEYLLSFRDELNARNGFAGWEKEIQKENFHSVLRIGEYTFSRYKVVWKYIATEFICAVISTVNDPYLGEKLLLPNEKVMYVSTDNEQEAYYLCGVLSSTSISQCVKGYMTPTSISTHVLDKLNIPSFDPKNEIQCRIASICKQGHTSKDINKYITMIDNLIPELYGAYKNCPSSLNQLPLLFD